MQNKTITAVLLLSLLFTGLHAQTTISGTIKDDLGDLVVGANIYIDGTYDGASTDVDGTFSFTTTAAGEKKLIVTYIGFKDFEKMLSLTGEPIALNIKLAPTAANLKEIIITAGAFEASDEKKRCCTEFA